MQLNPNAFPFATAAAAMSIRISSFASVKNERLEEDEEDEIAVIPNPREIVAPPHRCPIQLNINILIITGFPTQIFIVL